MGRDELMMMQFLSGAGGGNLGGLSVGGGLLQVVYLAFLLAVPIFRPDRIKVVSSFRAAYTCFGLSIITPSVVSLLMMYVASPNGGPGGGAEGIQSLYLLTAAGPILFGVSVILAMKAIVPGFIPPQNSGRPTSLDERRSNADSDSFNGGVESRMPASSHRLCQNADGDSFTGGAESMSP